MSEFREKTVSGVTWSAGSQAGRQIIVLASNVVLARLLTPGDFGVIATAIIFSNFAFVLAETGFSMALIQREEVTEAHLSSTFWVNLATGAVLFALFVGLAPLAGRAYAEPRLVAVMRLISLMFLIYPLGMIHKVVLTRRLEFRSIAIVEILAAWVGGVSAVALAWYGAGLFSIALQFVIEFVVGAAALWVLCEWRPRFLFSLSAVRELTHYSVNLLMTSVLGYWVRNVDNLLIGLYLGAFQLGLYSRAYAVMLFPLSRVTWVFSRVMIRSFAIIREDPARVRELFLKLTRVVSLITVPMMLGVVATAEPFVACVFGRQWMAMVPVLRVLAVVGMVQSVTSAINGLYLSHDKMALNFRVAFWCQALQVTGIVVGLRWGILGVATGYALACVAAEPFDAFFGLGIVGLRLRDFVGNISPILLCGAVMAVAVAALEAALPASIAALPRLAVEVAAGAALYTGMLHAFDVRGYGELKGLVRERLALAGGTA